MAFVLKSQTERDIAIVLVDFVCNTASRSNEVVLLEAIDSLTESRVYLRMLFNLVEYLLDHFLFLALAESLVKVVRVGSGHEDDAVVVEVIDGEVGSMPYFAMPVLIKADQRVVDAECADLAVDLIESSKCLTQDV